MIKVVEMVRCIDGCIRCCTETEMLLTPSDVRRIRSTGFSLSYFCESRGGVYRIRNVGGRCVFLNLVEGKCLIYSIRPVGCRAYPIVYDLDVGAVTVDRSCPSWSSISSSEFAAKARMLLEALREIGLPDA
ncbi:MAG: YkgJ family cysteine cluster protein [Thermoproteota archaeon]|nr:MAG: YkgJ family cysteine cluster protein [Candidatus Korarchaeota archaeon]